MPFTKASICGRVSRSFPPRYVNRHGTLGFSAVGIFATGHSSFLNPLWRQMFFGQRQYRMGNRRWGSADTLPRTDFRMPKHLPSEPYRLNSTIQNRLPLTVHCNYPRFFRTRRYTPRRRPKAIEVYFFHVAYALSLIFSTPAKRQNTRMSTTTIQAPVGTEYR